jgi:surface polysaccharide O-acyltransferase-like enzyme
MLFQNQVTFDGMWYIPMILCVYLFLPFVAMVKNQLSGAKEKAVYLPAVVIFAVTMVLPFLNNLLLLLGKESYLCAIEDVNLPIFYYLYILIGYLVGNGALKTLRTGTVAAITGSIFLICCGFQLWAYARPVDYLVAYDFPLMPFLAGFLFELLRRSEGFFRRLKKPIVRLSRISFGIYFLHIVIMTTLVTLLGDFQIILLPPVRFLVLEVVSVGLSILIIAPLSRIRPLRRYLFLIK